MKPEDIVALAIPATYLIMLAIEALVPARQYPKVRWWRGLGLFGLVVMMAIGAVAPSLIPVEWLDKHRLIDGTKLGVPLGVIVGYALLSFIAFAWHRALHRVPILWRLFHQIHHAPTRLDLSSGTVFHPTDIAMFTAIQVVGLTLVIGLDPLAAVIVGYVATVYSLFQHWNVKTPRWLGYVIQRPESHGLHHELDVHASNYSDFPLWDIIFGSFKNPTTFDGKVGFRGPSPVLKMLIFVDVNAANDAQVINGAAPAQQRHRERLELDAAAE